MPMFNFQVHTAQHQRVKLSCSLCFIGHAVIWLELLTLAPHNCLLASELYFKLGCSHIKEAVNSKWFQASLNTNICLHRSLTSS